MSAYPWTRRHWLSAAGAIALAGASAARAQTPTQALPPQPSLPGAPPALPGATPPAEVLQGQADEADRMTVQVRVNGKGPYPFVVDTGAEKSAITVELAVELGLPAGPNMIVHGVAGAMPAASARVAELAVGGQRLMDVDLPLLHRANVGAAGVLGIDAVQNQRVVLDFDLNQITVDPSPPRSRTYDEIVVSARSRFGQLVLVDSWFDHEPVLVVIDTGAQITIGNEAFRKKVRYGGSIGLNSTQTDIFSVTGQSTTGDWAVVPLVKVGGFELNHLPVVFSELHSFSRWRLGDQPALLLGMDVLRQFEMVQIDFARREVRFRGSRPPSLPVVSAKGASRLG